jgi:LPXTG-motif cell wall-anchored protein
LGRRIIPLVLLVLGGAVMLAPTALAQAGDQDCADFSSQAAAQAHLQADPSDPDGLDADNDGVACESFNYGSEGATGGVGADALPRTGSGTGPSLGIGAVLLAAGGVLVWLARYRPRHAAN